LNHVSPPRTSHNAQIVKDFPTPKSFAIYHQGVSNARVTITTVNVRNQQTFLQNVLTVIVITLLIIEGALFTKKYQEPKIKIKLAQIRPMEKITQTQYLTQILKTHIQTKITLICITHMPLRAIVIVITIIIEALFMII